MGLLSWAIFGALIGWLSSKVVGTDDQQGWILNIILGVIGAIAGGLVYAALFNDDFSIDWSIGSFIVSLIGGVVVSAGYGMLMQRR